MTRKDSTPGSKELVWKELGDSFKGEKHHTQTWGLHSYLVVMPDKIRVACGNCGFCQTVMGKNILPHFPMRLESHGTCPDSSPCPQRHSGNVKLLPCVCNGMGKNFAAGEGQPVSGCVVLSCQQGLNHEVWFMIFTQNRVVLAPCKQCSAVPKEWVCCQD